jgi:uncharacterized protein (TIGR02757 family)
MVFLKTMLDERVDFYNRPSFIQTDPICVPHQFHLKEDVEIAAFLTATIAWGNRKSILNNAMRLMEAMDRQPALFVKNFSEADLIRFRGFVHRTFNESDLAYFLYALKNIYLNHGGIEGVFIKGAGRERYIKDGIVAFRRTFLDIPHLQRIHKHLSDPAAGSAAKRLNMFLRWMIRDDGRGVDFGIWKHFHASDLYCPLDIHSGRVARKLGLLQRKQNDWKAVEELTANLRQFDPEDPVKYDFALFGMGVFEKY